MYRYKLNWSGRYVNESTVGRTTLVEILGRGVHPSETIMHPPCLTFLPPVSEKFSDSVENFQNVTFSRIFFRFSSAKVFDDFFSHQPQISNVPPYFRYFKCINAFIHFPTISTELFFNPTFLISLCFRQIYVFLTYFM